MRRVVGGAVALLLLGAAPVLADSGSPLPPMSVYGLVTVLGGSGPLPQGVVTALLGGTAVGSAVVSGGAFGGSGWQAVDLAVPGTAADVGGPVTFQVDGVAATATLQGCLASGIAGPAVTWRSGDVCEVALSVALPLTVAGAALPAASAGTPYTAALAALGGTAPYTWSLRASPPPGLALSAAGVLAGTPTRAGTYFLTAQAQDSGGPRATAACSCVLLVAPAGVGVTGASAAAAVGGSASAGGPGTPTPQTTATATGGSGTVALAEYGADPAGAAPLQSGGAYFDVALSPGSTLTQLAIVQCGLAGAGVVADWWNGGAWVLVSAQSDSASTGCVTVTVNASSAPGLADLGGTPFAAGLPSAGASGGGAGGAGTAPGSSLPSPAAAPGAQVIVGEAGGVLGSPDGAFSLGVPAGALPPAANLTLTESTAPPSGLPSGLVRASPVFAVTGAVLGSPLAASITYGASVLAGLAADRLCVYVEGAGGSWAFTPSVPGSAPASVSFAVSGPGTFVLVLDRRVLSDVPAGYWASGAIDALLAAGVVSGYPDGTFQPDATLSRADFVKLVVAALRLPAATVPASGFTDVEPTAWFAPHLAAAVHAGLVTGVSPTRFAPDQAVTREQAAVVLAKAFGLTGSAPLTFSDSSHVDGWARAAVQAAVAAGYLHGFPDGRLEPEAPLTRADAAALLAEGLQAQVPHGGSPAGA